MSDQNLLVYILIGTKSKPLASYSPYTGDFITYCETVLGDISHNSSRYVNNNDYSLFFINKKDITYLILTLHGCPQIKAMKFLERLQKEFEKDLIGKNLKKVSKYGLNNEFRDRLRNEYDMFYQNEETEHKVILNIEDEILNNYQYLKEREDKLSLMEQKAEELVTASHSFYKASKKVRRTAYLKK